MSNTTKTAGISEVAKEMVKEYDGKIKEAGVNVRLETMDVGGKTIAETPMKSVLDLRDALGLDSRGTEDDRDLTKTTMVMNKLLSLGLANVLLIEGRHGTIMRMEVRGVDSDSYKKRLVATAESLNSLVGLKKLVIRAPEGWGSGDAAKRRMNAYTLALDGFAEESGHRIKGIEIEYTW